MDKEHPLLCPYYIASKMFVPAETIGVRMVPSTELRSRAERVIQNPVPPKELGEVCGQCCPYELMMQAARTTDVVILNYHHLFDREIREQLYANLGVEPQDVLLLIDEAHNCGDTITAIGTVTMEQRDLEQASRELAGMRGRHKGAEAVRHVLPRLTEFMKGLENSHEAEDWFDPAIFDRMIVKESLYHTMDEIVDDLIGIAETIREKNQKAGEFRETAIERLTEFLLRLSQSASDPAYLTVYRRGDAGITLEVRNIDPAAALTEVCAAHACAVLISGTLSPVGSFRKFYFGDTPVTTLTLPNAFPKENRLVACANDITTAYSMRQNKENTTKVVDYIRAFSALKGNRAIYFPSYQILESYADLAAPHLRGRQVFIEPRDAADAGASLSAFLSLPLRGESGIMFAVCGGKWSEGLDYRGEMLNGAMVIGLPLAPFNRVRKMMIDYFRHKFGAEGEFLCYTLPAINRSLQALGRVLRTPEDKGVLVLAEKRFLENRVRSALPGWIQDEMIVGDCSRVQGRDRDMEMNSGSCRVGLWFVHVYWSGNTVHRVRFATTGISGTVPEPIRKFCSGRKTDLTLLDSSALHEDTVYARIYHAVQKIPYGSTVTYGEIGQMVGTSPRVVGQAMARNPTPLVIPCHRVVAADGIGGFSPSVEIKEELLAMEKKGLRKLQLDRRTKSI